jgi:hypothetical protein
MAQFGIIGDNFGVREDVPSVKLAASFLAGESSNVTYYDGCIRRMKGRLATFLDSLNAAVVIPDTHPIIHMHFHTDTNGTQSVFAYTKDHVYIWNSSLLQWDLMFTCSSSCTHWSSVSFKDKVISTNNIDMVQEWDEDTPAVAFATMGDPVNGIDLGGGVYLTQAAFAFVYETYLHLLNTTENGTVYKYRDRWCSRNDNTDFDETGSGDCGSHDIGASTSGPSSGKNITIVGVGAYSAGSSSLMCIFTNINITAAALVEDEVVFRYDEVSGSKGCLAPDSIVNDPDGNLYYLSTDWCIRRVFSNERLSQAINSTIQGINRTLYPYVRSSYIESLNQLWWSIPKDAASTGNDKVVRFNLDTGGWEPSQDLTISAFGKYGQQTSLSIDDIDVAIDEYDFIIDSVENMEGYTYDICTDYQGLSYVIAGSVTDRGSSFTGSAVFVVNIPSLSQYKRISGAWFWFESEVVDGYTVDISVRVHGSSSFTSVGTVELDGTSELVEQWVPMDERGKVIEVKVSGSNPFAFVAAIFDYTPDGED